MHSLGFGCFVHNIYIYEAMRHVGLQYTLSFVRWCDRDSVLVGLYLTFKSFYNSKYDD